jgi:hypothetical protein
MRQAFKRISTRLWRPMRFAWHAANAAFQALSSPSPIACADRYKTTSQVRDRSTDDAAASDRRTSLYFGAEKQSHAIAVSDQLHRPIAKVASQLRLQRRELEATSRYLSAAHVVRTEAPLRDTREQQRSFKFGSAKVGTLHHAVSHARRQCSGVVRKRIFSWSCLGRSTHPL